jgi:hypothetical protein
MYLLMRTIKIKQERVVPTGHPKMNQQRTSKIIQERVVPTGHPKMNQQRTSKIKQERVVPTGHPKTNLNYSLLLKVFFFRKQIFGKYISVLLNCLNYILK